MNILSLRVQGWSSFYSLYSLKTGTPVEDEDPTLLEEKDMMASVITVTQSPCIYTLRSLRKKREPIGYFEIATCKVV